MKILSDLKLISVSGEFKIGLETIRNLVPKRFKYQKNIGQNPDEQVGIIADEVEKFFEGAVRKEQNFYDPKKSKRSVKYIEDTHVLYGLVNAVKELDRRFYGYNYYVFKTDKIGTLVFNKRLELRYDYSFKEKDTFYLGGLLEDVQLFYNEGHIYMIAESRIDDVMIDNIRPELFEFNYLLEHFLKLLSMYKVSFSGQTLKPLTDGGAVLADAKAYADTKVSDSIAPLATSSDVATQLAAKEEAIKTFAEQKAESIKTQLTADLLNNANLDQALTDAVNELVASDTLQALGLGDVKNELASVKETATLTASRLETTSTSLSEVSTKVGQAEVSIASLVAKDVAIDADLAIVADNFRAVEGEVSRIASHLA